MTVRDASSILGISEKEILELVETNRLPAYRVGGVYLRFKREQLDNFKTTLKPYSAKIASHPKITFREKLSDFFYFYDFYLLSALIVLFILIVIFHY